MVALLATVLVLAVDASDSARSDALLSGVTPFLAFARCIHRQAAGIQMLTLDAVGTASLAGTGAPVRSSARASAKRAR